MVRREIDLDEQSDRILSDLSEDYEGDPGKALADLLQAHESIEAFVGECEEVHRESLLRQKERAEREFREGSFTSWDEVKRRYSSLR